MDYADLSLKQAAEVAGVSVATMRRKRLQLQAVGAVCEPDGWHVSTAHLAAVGLLDRVTAEQQGVSTMAPPLIPPQGEIEALRGRLAEAEKRAAIAEAVAAERLVTIEAQRQALRLLEAAPQTQEPVPVVSEEDGELKRRRWWSWRV